MCRPAPFVFTWHWGLLPPPLVGGRAACYGEEHLKELDRIKTLQGQTLAQIAWQLGEDQSSAVRQGRNQRGQRQSVT